MTTCSPGQPSVSGLSECRSGCRGPGSTVGRTGNSKRLDLSLTHLDRESPRQNHSCSDRQERRGRLQDRRKGSRRQEEGEGSPHAAPAVTRSVGRVGEDGRHLLPLSSMGPPPGDTVARVLAVGGRHGSTQVGPVYSISDIPPHPSSLTPVPIPLATLIAPPLIPIPTSVSGRQK